MTKLITIDYDEYLELIRVKTENRIQAYKILIRDLSSINREISRNSPSESMRVEDIRKFLNSTVNFYENKVIELEKEGKEND